MVDLPKVPLLSHSHADSQLQYPQTDGLRIRSKMLYNDYCSND